MYTYINIFLITCRVTVAPDVVCLVYPIARKRFLANPRNSFSCFFKNRLLLLFSDMEGKRLKRNHFFKEITLKAKT